MVNARDESQHLAISQHIIKNFQRHENDKEMLEVIKERTKFMYDMLNDSR